MYTSVNAWDFAADFACGIEPILDCDLNLFDRLVPGFAVSDTTGRFGNASNEGFIVIAPIKNCAVGVLDQRSYPVTI